ncbi:hypothetical protein KSB_62060 [Ktedonobacter robiniae]|uniref:Uncharacterized protein n=1 Tax=Ktedonobacter robiniae TaxID=2778365 RepID=A0ABQ3UXZ4_9CHLR|nr:hypothetical protein KSB_62060 [Ktedonobacter robiniae]
MQPPTIGFPALQIRQPLAFCLVICYDKEQKNIKERAWKPVRSLQALLISQWTRMEYI